MKIEKKDINVFLALWIKSDPELWGELRDIQIKLLLERIVKEKSFAEMSKGHGVPEKTLRLIFEAIIERIKLTLGKDVADQLSKLNRLLDSKNEMRIESDFSRVFLN